MSNEVNTITGESLTSLSVSQTADVWFDAAICIAFTVETQLFLGEKLKISLQQMGFSVHASVHVCVCSLVVDTDDLSATLLPPVH